MKNKGFTLIELIISIIVIGILAATAIPRFINIDTDAENASLISLKAAIESAINISHKKMVIDGMENDAALTYAESAAFYEGCEWCSFDYGYPVADTLTLKYLVDGIGIVEDDDSFALVEWTKIWAGAVVLITPTDNAKRLANNYPVLIEDNCYVKYTSYDQEPKKPLIEIVACD
ncbi:prepilin-type N-terminal cleavage/methylation domain-containing protein [Moritella marina ATCC 15381]|uniref:Prepilin-type N-terminal cleavage/methylation domain-containing protein n=1 Tax=Moritella marina ATCC 15381 TaxID=1202962 RepID=A0A5J6WML8_MORMI|nr:prepilin-type N-terminal cleavage/methylation domain-containing protein [Moritella marina]QFI38501.1 prepilin-type N-terminal cleavage/methylation domain-containing protein [Moritella marina ATCC 15381]